MLAQFQANASLVKSGASLYGPVAGEWPAWFVDAAEILGAERATADSLQGIGMESAYAMQGLSHALLSRR